MSRVLPILFNTEMVRAILDDRKTTTRRILKLPKHIQKQENGLYTLFTEGTCYENQHLEEIVNYIKPTYQLGDILYVRETWCNANKEGVEPDYYYYADTFMCEDYDRTEWKWHPSIHMPKDAARIWLRVTDVRVEWLHDMTLDDFLNEGVVIRPEAFNDPENAYQQAKNVFINIWDSTVKKTDKAIYGWDADPYVWTTGFERCEKPEE